MAFMRKPNLPALTPSNKQATPVVAASANTPSVTPSNKEPAMPNVTTATPVVSKPAIPSTSAAPPSFSREELRAHLETSEVQEALARALTGAVGGLVNEPKEFSSGSVGYHSAKKITVLIDGKPTKFQANLTLTAIGSKGL
jgi:hypothetical protein